MDSEPTMARSMRSGATWAMPVKRAVCCLSTRDDAALSLVRSSRLNPHPRKPVIRGSEASSIQVWAVLRAIAELPESETPSV